MTAPSKPLRAEALANLETRKRRQIPVPEPGLTPEQMIARAAALRPNALAAEVLTAFRRAIEGLGRR